MHVSIQTSCTLAAKTSSISQGRFVCSGILQKAPIKEFDVMTPMCSFPDLCPFINPLVLHSKLITRKTVEKIYKWYVYEET